GSAYARGAIATGANMQTAARGAKRLNMRELAPLVVLGPALCDAPWSSKIKGPKESVATNHEPVAFRFGEQRPNSCHLISVELESPNL
ncbi:hypothetical protein, partial [Mycolicibacterium peregrinum]